MLAQGGPHISKGDEKCGRFIIPGLCRHSSTYGSVSTPVKQNSAVTLSVIPSFQIEFERSMDTKHVDSSGERRPILPLTLEPFPQQMECSAYLKALVGHEGGGRARSVAGATRW